MSMAFLLPMKGTKKGLLHLCNSPKGYVDYLAV